MGEIKKMVRGEDEVAIVELGSQAEDEMRAAGFEDEAPEVAAEASETESDKPKKKGKGK